MACIERQPLSKPDLEGNRKVIEQHRIFVDNELGRIWKRLQLISSHYRSSRRQKAEHNMPNVSGVPAAARGKQAGLLNVRW
jgi:hypothetical protein